MYLPLQLNYGIIAIYKVRNRSSINNIAAPSGFNWGTVYQISPYGIPDYRSVGQSVLYKGEDTICQLAYARTLYPLIEEARLVTTELNLFFS